MVLRYKFFSLSQILRILHIVLNQISFTFRFMNRSNSIKSNVFMVGESVVDKIFCRLPLLLLTFFWWAKALR